MFAYHSLRHLSRLLAGMAGPVSSVLLATTLLLPFASTAHAQSSPSPLPLQDDVLGAASALHVSLAGRDPSSFVTPGGAFTYTVPIDIPPGRHGLQPSLLLFYNSLNHDGLAGMGWSLAGIPVITRVAAQSGINYNGQDTYAVNRIGWGTEDDPQNRLVDIGNAHYHTMDETWGDYQPQGKCGDGACYWILRDGGGTTWFFGGDAKFQSSPDTSFAPALWERDNGDVAHRGIFVWSLYKVVDLYGNAYQVSYSNPADGSNLYPASIRYTTSETQNVPTREITFSYEARPDVTPAPVLFTQRLKTITIRSGGQVVHQYVLNYYSYAESLSVRSLLSSVEVLGSDLKAAQPAIRFHYQRGRLFDGSDLSKSLAFQRVQGPRPQGVAIPNAGQYLVGDINGDGRQDIVSVYEHYDGEQISYALGTDSGLGPVVHYRNTVQKNAGGFVLHGNWQAVLADVNGDGKDDLVLVKLGRKEICTRVALGTLSGFGPLTDSHNCLSGVLPDDDESDLDCHFSFFGTVDAWCLFRILRADLNGDHRIDLAFVLPNGGPIIAYALGTPGGVGQVRLAAQFGAEYGGVGGTALAADFNGDGKTDVLASDLYYPHPVTYMLGANGGLRTPLIIDPVTIEGANNPLGNTISLPIAADLNGDGRADLLFALSPTQVGVLYGHSGFDYGLKGKFADFGVKYTGKPPNVDRPLVLQEGDFNGDGIPDALLGSESLTNRVRDTMTVILGSPNGRLTVKMSSTETPDEFAIADLAGYGRSLVVYMDAIWDHSSFSYAQVSDAGLSVPAPLVPPEPVGVHKDAFGIGGPQLLTADLNGDGIADLLMIPPDGIKDELFRYLLSDPTPPDLLTSVENSTGGTLAIEYKMADQFSHAVQNNVSACGGLTQPSDLPFCGNPNTSPRPLVSRLIRDNGRGEVQSSRYDYFNGRYYPGPRFLDNDLGFERVDITNEQTKVRETTLYDQVAPFLQHKPLEESSYDSQGNVLSREQFTYTVEFPYPVIALDVVRFVQLDTDLTRLYEKNVLVRATKISYTYRAYGAITRQTTCEGTTCTTTDTEYTNDTAHWLLHRIDSVKTWLGDGSSTGGSPEHILDWVRLYYYPNGYELQMRERMLCEDAEACTCPVTLLSPCTGGAQGNPPRWVIVEKNRLYDAFGDLVYFEDTYGHATRNQYDPLSGEVTVTTRYALHGDALIQLATTRTYDYAGRLASETDLNRQTTRFFYDQLGRKSRVEYPNGRIERYFYVAIGEPNEQYVYKTTETPSGALLWGTQYFDGFGIVYQMQSKGDNGKIVSRERQEFFTANNQHVVRYTEPHFLGEAAQAIEISYDSLERPVLVDRIDGSLRTMLKTFVYAPRSLTVTDALNQVVTYSFDDRGLITKESDSVGITTYSYDAVRRLKGVILANGQSIVYSYDNWGRKRSEDDPARGHTTYGYDDLGNLTSVVDARSAKVTYTYDELNRLWTATDAGGTIYYTYDGNNQLGRLTRVDDHTGSTQLLYDLAGNVTTKLVTLKGYPTTLKVSYDYDALDRLVSKTFPDGHTIFYSYTDGGNLAAITQADGTPISTFGNYTAQGQTGQITTPAANTLYTYYPDGLYKDMETTSASSPSAQLQKDHYDYDPLGNVLAITDQRQQKQSNGINTDESQSFTYDNAYRLIGANGVYGGQQYGYDTFGDITRLGAVTIQYNGRDATGMQGQSVVFHEVYDAAGAVESKDDPSGHWDYQYDAWHQLTTVTRNGKLLLQLEYNFAGDRVKKVYASGKNGTLTTYYLDGYEIRESSKLPGAYSSTELIVAPGFGLIASITTGSIPGQPTLATVLKARGKALSGNTFAGPPVETLFYLRDPLSSTEVVITPDGQEVERAIYEPYGRISTSHSTGYDVSSVKFTGKELDEETNLTNYGARYYDDTTARFITADPEIAGRASNPLNFNRYAYVRDNPLVYRDPTGFDPQAAGQSWFSRLWNDIKPDTVTLSLSFGPVGGSLTIDNNLNVYGGLSLGLSSNLLKDLDRVPKLAWSLTANRIIGDFDPRRATEEEIKQFVSGVSKSWGLCYYLCGGQTSSGGMFSTDIGVGMGIGGAGVTGAELLYERHPKTPEEEVTFTSKEAAADLAQAEAELNGVTKSDVEFSNEEADPITFITFTDEEGSRIIIMNFSDAQGSVVEGQINSPDIQDQEPVPPDIQDQQPGP